MDLFRNLINLEILLIFDFYLIRILKTFKFHLFYIFI